MIETESDGAAAAGETLDDTGADGFDDAAADAEDFDDDDDDGDAGNDARRPAEADPYGLEDLAEAYGFAPDDALAVLARDHCQSAGLAPERFRGLVEGYVDLAFEQAEAAHEAEYRALERDWGPGVQRQLDELTAWAGAVSHGREEFEALRLMATTAAGVRVLARLRDREFRSGGSEMTHDDGRGFDEQVRELMRSDAYRRGDKHVHARVQRMFERRYPGEMVTAASERGGAQVGEIVLPEKRRRGW